MTANLTTDASPLHGAVRNTTAALARPFYFMVPFWGERYRRYFVDRLLPSFLAPNNLPLLRADQGHRFLIATTPEDWAAIIDLPIFERLREHATPTLIEIPRPGGATAPGSTDAIVHQDLALRRLVEAAFAGRAYGSIHWPDCIVSDGVVASLLKHVREGHRLVLCPALRQVEETVIAELMDRGYLQREAAPSKTGTPITVPPRALADIMVRHLHPDVGALQEGAAGQPLLPPFRYWRLHDGAGIILHTFHGSPLLMDYGAVEHHDIECLVGNSFEDVYVARNFDDKDGLYVVEDSDEFCIVSLTPYAVGEMPRVGSDITAYDDGFWRSCAIAVSLSFYIARMPLKRAVFQRSIRWHGAELDRQARHEEAKISALVDRSIRYSRYTAPLAAILRCYRAAPIFAATAPYARRLLSFLRGDRLVWSYVVRRVGFAMRGPFKRAAFWFATGKDLDRFDPLHLSFRRTAGRATVSASMFTPSPSTAVILAVGQSNIANECDPTALHDPKGAVYNFNFFDGKCYAAKDPLLGASITRSNLLTRLGELFVERGRYRQVLLVPIAHGGTYVSEWAPDGRMFPRLQWTLQQLNEQGIGISHILWQQGESEAAKRSPDADAWARDFMAMVDAIRTIGVNAPIYVAQCTICRNDPNEIIRQAQRRVVNPAQNILPGPDIDQIGHDQRYDGCHLSAAGLTRAAELWCAALSSISS
jgi:hypothetical protein